MADDTHMRIGEVARRAGVRVSLIRYYEAIRQLVEHGNDPMSERLWALAERKLPEIEALIDRAQRVRTWLQAATGCDCERLADCALSDDAALAATRDARAGALPCSSRNKPDTLRITLPQLEAYLCRLRA